MPDKRSTAVEGDQTQLGIEMEAVADVADGRKKNRKKSQTTGKARKDKRGLHTMRHAMLTRYPLEALARLGENVRHLRKIEREFRDELKPVGMVGQMLFDRMFSAYLRCLLAARAEAIALIPYQENAESPGRMPHLAAEALPTLVWPADDIAAQNLQRLPADLFRQLALVQKYDSHFSREMFRSLGLLLVLKDGGEAGLTKCVGKSLGLNRESPEG